MAPQMICDNKSSCRGGPVRPPGKATPPPTVIPVETGIHLEDLLSVSWAKHSFWFACGQNESQAGIPAPRLRELILVPRLQPPRDRDVVEAVRIGEVPVRRTIPEHVADTG